MNTPTKRSIIGTSLKLAMLAIFSLSLAACGKKGDKPTPPQEPAKPQTSQEK